MEIVAVVEYSIEKIFKGITVTISVTDHVHNEVIVMNKLYEIYENPTNVLIKT